MQEFLAKASAGVAELAEQRAWVASLAERKREERREREHLRAAEAASRADAERQIREHEGAGAQRVGSGEHGSLSSNNPYKRMFEGEALVDSAVAQPAVGAEAGGVEQEGGVTDEERTLGLVVAASEVGHEAMRLYEAHQERRQEAAELREAEERSRLETRFDRSTAGTPDAEGAYHPANQAGPGEGTSASTNPYAAHMTPPKGKVKRQSTDDSAYSPPPPVQPRDGPRLIDFDAQPDYTASPLASPATETAPGQGLAQTSHASAVESAYGGLAELGLGTPPRGARAERSATVGSEVLQDPTEPSSKALGKLRRVSVRENSETDAEEKMRELEAKLRAKYERGVREGREGQGEGVEAEGRQEAGVSEREGLL